MALTRLDRVLDRAIPAFGAKTPHVPQYVNKTLSPSAAGNAYAPNPSRSANGRSTTATNASNGAKSPRATAAEIARSTK